jgi:hypothetical protein
MEPKKSGSKPEAHCFVPKKTRALALGKFHQRAHEEKIFFKRNAGAVRADPKLRNLRFRVKNFFCAQRFHRAVKIGEINNMG